MTFGCSPHINVPRSPKSRSNSVLFCVYRTLYDSVHDAVIAEIIQPYIYAEYCRVFSQHCTDWNLCGPHIKFPPTIPRGSNYDRGFAWVCTCASVSVCGGLKVILRQTSCWAPDGLSLTVAGHRSTLVCVCVCVCERHICPEVDDTLLISTCFCPPLIKPRPPGKGSTLLPPLPMTSQNSCVYKSRQSVSLKSFFSEHS